MRKHDNVKKYDKKYRVVRTCDAILFADSIEHNTLHICVRECDILLHQVKRKLIFLLLILIFLGIYPNPRLHEERPGKNLIETEKSCLSGIIWGSLQFCKFQ